VNIVIHLRLSLNAQTRPDDIRSAFQESFYSRELIQLPVAQTTNFRTSYPDGKTHDLLSVGPVYLMR
jgi:hypothetical protein